jgi:hypothetical protein
MSHSSIARTVSAAALVLAAAFSPAAAWAEELRLAVQLERRSPQGWAAAPEGASLTAGEEIRFAVVANFAGLLRVSGRDSEGEVKALFPAGPEGAALELAAGRRVYVPEEGSSFEVSGPAGKESVYWIVSPPATGSTNLPIPRAPEQTPGAGRRSRCIDEIAQPGGHDCAEPRADDEQGPTATVFTARGPLAGALVFELVLERR